MLVKRQIILKLVVVPVFYFTKEKTGGEGNDTFSTLFADWN